MVKTIEQYIINLDSKKAGILAYIREMILSCSPYLNEKITSGTLSYYYHGNLCSIHPHKNGVDIHFINGKGIETTEDLLATGENHAVKTISFSHLKDIDYKQVIAMVKQAMQSNELYNLRDAAV